MEPTAESIGPRETPGPAATGEFRFELSRDMGLLHVTMIGVGAMIGAGIFGLTGIAAGHAGPALILAFLLNGVVTSITALAYAELGSCFPEAGGGYLWVKEALPQPNGFLSGWMSWFAHAVACSFYAIVFGAFLVEFAGTFVDFGAFIPDWSEVVRPYAEKGVAVLITFVFCYINFRGAKETGQVETIVTLLKILVILVFIVSGFYFIRAEEIAWRGRFRPFLPAGMTGVVVAMGLTFIAFEGYEIIAQCGEEVKRPRRNIPLSIMLSLVIVVPIYILVGFVAIGAVIPGPGFETVYAYLGALKETALVRAADQFMRFGGLVFVVGGLLATMSALNATVYSSSRVSFAMGRDHNLPSIFGRVHPRTKTPHWAVLISGVFIALMAALLPIEDIASATDAMFLFLFMLVNLSVVNLRRHRPDLDRGFRVPLSPFLPILAVLLNLSLAAFLLLHYPLGIAVTLGYIAAGVVMYYAYSRRRETEATGLPTILEHRPIEEQTEKRILIPLANPATVEALTAFATEVASALNASIRHLHVIQVPPQLPLREGHKFLGAGERLIEQAAAAVSTTDVPHGGMIKVAHNVARAVVETAAQQRVNLLVLGWQGHFRRYDYVFGTTLDEVILNAPCDVVMVRLRGKDPFAGLRRILVPVANLRAAELSLRLASILAAGRDLPIRLFHVTSREKREETERFFAEQMERFSGRVDVARAEMSIVAGSNVLGAILTEIQRDDLIIMGAAREGLVKRALFGEIPENVARLTENPLLITKPYTGHIWSWFQKVFGSRRSVLPDQ